VTCLLSPSARRMCGVKVMRQRKLQFFEVGSQALSSVSEYRGAYACPICQHGFDVSAIDSGALTLEDAPPRSLGGRPIALTTSVKNSSRLAAIMSE
jgi:hypothetical protein